MKRILHISLLLFISLSLSGMSYGQEKLNLKEALEQALKNNFDIRLQSNQAKIAKNNVSLANAGITPRVNSKKPHAK